MLANLLCSFILAAFVTAVLIPPLVRRAELLQAYDLPGGRKVHQAPVPRLGGLAMVVGTLLPLLIWGSMDTRTVGFLGGVLVILLFGVWDDLKGINYRLKFLGQIIAVLIVVVYGGVVIRFVPFGLEPLPDYVAIPLTIFTLVGVTNAVNLADGLDGLAGGITLLSLASIGLLAYPTGDITVLLLTASVIGSIVGFLRFNTYPARIFMGDGGSQFLGFAAGALAIMLTQESSNALSLALPLMILGLPILDTAMVIGERLYERRSPFLPDRNHLHHKMLTLGAHHYEAVFAIYVLQTLLVCAAYFLRFEMDALIISLYVVFCVALIGSLKVGIASGWRIHGRLQRGAEVVPGWIRWLRKDQRILKMAFYFAVVAVPSYLAVEAVFVERVPKDIGVLACALLAVLLALYVKRRRKPFNVVERACAYIVGATIVYLGQAVPGVLADFALYRNILFAGMTVAVVIGFRLSKERFSVTPTDFLVILLALVVLMLPNVDIGLGNTGLAVAMLIVLFYSTELVLNNIWRRWDVIRFSTYFTLAVLGLRGVAGAFA